MANIMLYEISRRGITISKHEETTIVYHNSTISLRGDKHLHVLEFSYNLQSLDKKLDLVESSIPCPKNSASMELLSKRSKEGLKNIELMEMITNPYLWPYSTNLNQEMTSIIAFKWSPTNLIHNNQSVLAILNSVGNLEFFGKQRNSYVSLYDFSLIIKQYLESESLIPHGVREKYSLNKLKEIVFSICISAICWCPKINNDKSCYLVTAQKNACIFFWCIKFQESDLSVNNIGKIETTEVDIITMEWIPCGNDTFLFVYSNMLGEMTGKFCHIKNKKLEEITKIDVWTHKDRMIPKHIQYILQGNRLILIFDKHRHLVIQMLDQDFKLLSQVIKIINDVRITTITINMGDIYVATVNTNIFKVNIKIEDEIIDFSLDQINLKETYPNHELYGLDFSNNGVISSIAIIDRRLMFRKEQLKLFVVSLTLEEEKELDILLHKNPSNKLTNMWDCIELIRCKAMKTKKLPTIDFESLYKEAEGNIYKMKIYLILVKLYNSLEGILKNSSKGMLPETSISIVQDKILAMYACNRLCEVNEKINKDCIIDKLESDCLFGCKNYLEYYCKTYDKSLSNLEPKVDFKQIDMYCGKTKLEPRKHVCQFCDDIIDGFACKNGHMNMFCVVTLTPIESIDYLVCGSCNVTAKMDLLQYEPTCVFCDSSLNCITLAY